MSSLRVKQFCKSLVEGRELQGRGHGNGTADDQLIRAGDTGTLDAARICHVFVNLVALRAHGEVSCTVLVDLEGKRRIAKESRLKLER